MKAMRPHHLLVHVLVPALLTAGLGVGGLAPTAAAPAAVPTCDGEEATIVGTSGPDRLSGTPARDVIVALGGRDVVRARGGDDLVCGGRGADTLAGGPGDDGSPYDDTITGTARDDRIAGVHDDVVEGGTGDDVLWSGVGRNDLRGEEGRDHIDVTGTDPTSVHGGDGLDSVQQFLATAAGGVSDGGPGRDVLTVLGTPYEGASPRARYTLDLRSGTSSVSSDPAVTGTVGGYEEYRLAGHLRWRFFGTPDGDEVWAMSGGPLRALTYAGDDHLIGTAHADHLDGGTGTDRAEGREGDDTCLDIEKGNKTC